LNVLGVLSALLRFIRSKELKIGFSISASQTGWTNMKDWLKLLDSIHLAYNHPEYTPKDGVTHCNQFVNEVCESLGYKSLDGKLANDICDILANDPTWSEITMDKCQDLANGGSLIIAGIKESGHGHVNVICPGKKKTSGRWGEVPTCANVGKENFIGKGINWAFSDMPKFWVWRQTL
jgi:hypothetical protein